MAEPLKNPTKSEEIEVLQNAISTLGVDSYLGPWLRGVIGSVEQMIRSDFYPDVDPIESGKRLRGLIEDAEREAKRIVESAEAAAAKREEEARKNVRAIAGNVYAHLKVATDRLEIYK